MAIFFCRVIKPSMSASGTRGAARDIDVHGNHFIDALEYVVAVLPIRAAFVRTGTHRDNILGLRHLRKEGFYPRGHFKGDRTGYNH